MNIQDPAPFPQMRAAYLRSIAKAWRDPAYQKALWREDGRSTILVEHGDFYNEK